MTVKELRDVLARMPQDMQVICDVEVDHYDPVTEVPIKVVWEDDWRPDNGNQPGERVVLLGEEKALRDERLPLKTPLNVLQEEDRLINRTFAIAREQTSPRAKPTAKARELFDSCMSNVCATRGIKHPNDERFGFAWDAVLKEFRQRYSSMTPEERKEVTVG